MEKNYVVSKTSRRTFQYISEREHVILAATFYKKKTNKGRGKGLLHRNVRSQHEPARTESVRTGSITPPTFPRKELEELIRWVTLCAEFIFNDLIYKQIDGIAIGSPLGPILANIFVSFHEKKLYNAVSDPLIYCRFDDDTFALFKDETQCDQFLSDPSSLHQFPTSHPGIYYTTIVLYIPGFTIEKENMNRLPFLDVLAKKDKTNSQPPSTENPRSPDNIFRGNHSVHVNKRLV